MTRCVLYSILQLEPTLAIHLIHIVGCCTAQPARGQLVLFIRKCISQGVTKDVISVTYPGIFSHPTCLKKNRKKIKGKKVKEKKSLSWCINRWYLNSSENLKEMKKQSGYTTPNNVVRQNAS
ncbi:hypothetical protein ACQKWADRAFT_59418 [Trichoderma austrokoningii]